MYTDAHLFEIFSHAAQEWMPLPHVDANQMRELDRIAVEDIGLGILQMMENAGRNLARLAIQSLANPTIGRVVVVAGSGGNGGGVLCAARHLRNRGVPVSVLLSQPAAELQGPAAAQLNILRKAGFEEISITNADLELSKADLILDALIGYSLIGAPIGTAADLIVLINQSSSKSGAPVISLDLPSGLDATSGETPGSCVRASKTLTLALPKPGLINPLAGELYLADIGIPPAVYHPLGLSFTLNWGADYVLPIRRIEQV